MRLITRLLALPILLATQPALAGFEDDFDAEAKPWQEVEAQLPNYPKSEGLIPLHVSNTTRHQHYIDPDSLSSGEDGVVRYTVVIRTAGGAQNVSFEGLRCVSGERKLYAFGHAGTQGGGHWTRNRHARWEPVQARLESSYQRELFFHYFCTVDGPGDMKLMRHALAVGGIRRGGD